MAAFLEAQEERAAVQISRELMKIGAIVHNERHDASRHERVVTRTLAVVMPHPEGGELSTYDFAQQIVEQREAAVRQVVDRLHEAAASLSTPYPLAYALVGIAERLERDAGTIARDWTTSCPPASPADRTP